MAAVRPLRGHYCTAGVLGRKLQEQGMTVSNFIGSSVFKIFDYNIQIVFNPQPHHKKPLAPTISIPHRNSKNQNINIYINVLYRTHKCRPMHNKNNIYVHRSTTISQSYFSITYNNSKNIFK